MDARILMLARQPLIGESRDESLPELRSFSVSHHVIYYRPLARQHPFVEIVRVLHGARDVRRLF